MLKWQIIFFLFKTKLLILGLDVACFADYRLKYYKKTVQLSSPLNIKLKRIVDMPLLKRIVEQCNFTYMGQIFKTMYSLFFAFVKFCSSFYSTVFPLKHLARRDLIFRPEKVVILLKSSKAMPTHI